MLHLCCCRVAHEHKKKACWGVFSNVGLLRQKVNCLTVTDEAGQVSRICLKQSIAEKHGLPQGRDCSRYWADSMCGIHHAIGDIFPFSAFLLGTLFVLSSRGPA
jgi:hypothetical protein